MQRQQQKIKELVAVRVWQYRRILGQHSDHTDTQSEQLIIASGNRIENLELNLISKSNNHQNKQMERNRGPRNIQRPLPQQSELSLPIPHYLTLWAKKANDKQSKKYNVSAFTSGSI